MNENQLVQDDEISLFDLWQSLQDGWRYIVGGATVGVLGASLTIAQISPKYEAISVLQIGKIAGSPIEDAATTLERLKSSAFALELAQLTKNQILLDRVASGGLHNDIIKAQLVKGTSLIEVRTTGDSPEKANEINLSLLKLLVSRHTEISAPLLQKIQGDLLLAKEKMNLAEAELSEVTKVSSAAIPLDQRFSQISLMTSLRLQKQSELYVLKQTMAALELSLVKPSTQPSAAIEAVFSPDKAVSPKKSLLMALGLVGGLLLGVMSVFIRDAWCRAKNRRMVEALP